MIAQMKAEEAVLLRKLEAVRAVLALYGNALPSAAIPAEKPPATVIEGARPAAKRGQVPLDRFSAYGAEIVRASMQCIAGQPIRPVRTRALVDLVQSTGIAIRGENKVNALSALLARSEDLLGHGKRGWSLASDNGRYGGTTPGENEASPGYAEDASDPGTQDGSSSESSPSNPSPNGSTS